MERPFGRVAVQEIIIHRQQVNVMHYHVVTLITTEQKTDVQKRGTVEPVINGRN